MVYIYGFYIWFLYMVNIWRLYMVFIYGFYIWFLYMVNIWVLYMVNIWLRFGTGTFFDN